MALLEGRLAATGLPACAASDGTACRDATGPAGLGGRGGRGRGGGRGRSGGRGRGGGRGGGGGGGGIIGDGRRPTAGGTGGGSGCQTKGSSTSGCVSPRERAASDRRGHPAHAGPRRRSNIVATAAVVAAACGSAHGRGPLWRDAAPGPGLAAAARAAADPTCWQDAKDHDAKASSWQSGRCPVDACASSARLLATSLLELTRQPIHRA